MTMNNVQDKFHSEKLAIYQVFKYYNNKIVQVHCRWVYIFFHPFHVLSECAKCLAGAEKVDANARLSTDGVLFRMTQQMPT